MDQETKTSADGAVRKRRSAKYAQGEKPETASAARAPAAKKTAPAAGRTARKSTASGGTGRTVPAPAGNAAQTGGARFGQNMDPPAYSGPVQTEPMGVRNPYMSQPQMTPVQGVPQPYAEPQWGYAPGQPAAPAGGFYQQPFQTPPQAPQRPAETPAPEGIPGRGYIPPRPPVSEPPREKKPGKAGKVFRALLIAVLAVALGAGGLVGLRAYQHRRDIERAVIPYNAVYCEGVYVDGIHLGGMTQEEAWEAVTQNAESHANWHVRLVYEGTVLREITSADLGMTVNVEDALRSAWEQGHLPGATLEERYEVMQQLREQPFEAWTATPSADTTVIDAILATVSMDLYVAPQDASIAAFIPDRTYPFTFNEEVVGRRVNSDALKEQLFQMLAEKQSGDVEIVPEVLMPAVTVASLKEDTVALRGTGTTRISTSSEENRNNNIRRAFELISGKVIQPGESFSFNGTVGQRTVKNGFFPAVEYVYDEVADGIGGGVCQASTTVYLAAVRAGMRIDKREPHSMKVNYTPYGKDATVYWFSNHRIDLQFTNTTDKPIYITAAVQSAPGNRTRLDCNVRIYGAGLGNVTYDIVTEETVIPAPEEPEIVRDKNQEHVTYVDEEYELRQPADGMAVESYRVKYVDGKEVSREHLYSDIYKPKARKIMVGIKERPVE